MNKYETVSDAFLNLISDKNLKEFKCARVSQIIDTQWSSETT